MNKPEYTELLLTIAESNDTPAGLEIELQHVLVACAAKVWVCMGENFGQPKTLFMMSAGKDFIFSAFWDLMKKGLDDQGEEVKSLLANLLLKK